jgi:hypothetical protein
LPKTGAYKAFLFWIDTAANTLGIGTVSSGGTLAHTTVATTAQPDRPGCNWQTDDTVSVSWKEPNGADTEIWLGVYNDDLTVNQAPATGLSYVTAAYTTISTSPVRWWTTTASNCAMTLVSRLVVATGIPEVWQESIIGAPISGYYSDGSVCTRGQVIIKPYYVADFDEHAGIYVEGWDSGTIRQGTCMWGQIAESTHTPGRCVWSGRTLPFKTATPDQTLGMMSSNEYGVLYSAGANSLSGDRYAVCHYLPRMILQNRIDGKNAGSVTRNYALALLKREETPEISIKTTTSTLHISQAQPMVFHGTTPLEQGFCVWPEKLT